MDFVTITDHDTIDGVLTIADRPDVFVSEELTAFFKGEPQAVHILCLGITPGDHEWLQAHSDDVEVVANYLHEQEITCALAHPFYAVEAPLLPRLRRRLAQLFESGEVRNGSRAPELNHPAAIYVETHGRASASGGRRPRRRRTSGAPWSRRPSRPARPSSSRICPRGPRRGAGRSGLGRQVGARRDGAWPFARSGRGESSRAPDPSAVLRWSSA
jgi:hypothetical protein